MKTKQMLTLTAAVLLLLLPGCRKNGAGAPIHVQTPTDAAAVPSAESPDDNPKTQEETDSAGELPASLPLFGSDGRPLFTVIKPAGADGDTEACASALIKAVNGKTGKKFKLTDDSAEAEEGAFEILIGPTSRPESGECVSDLAALASGGSAESMTNGGYLMALYGNKIALAATDGGMLRKAVDDFADAWLGQRSVSIPAGGMQAGARESLTLTALTADTRPALIEPLRPAGDSAFVIADIVATDAEYGADPTGQRDSTGAIRMALNACAKLGGGTVWLPAGQYLVTSTVEIPAFVTLRGEAAAEKPESAEDYGTLIVAKSKSGKSPAASLFVLRGSCGAEGLSVWYPEQSMDKPVTYPYTFYVTGNGQGGYMLQTIRDVLVVNGWCGIGACVIENNAHEQTTIERFRGTFLDHAVKSCNEADVGTWKSIRVSPSFWADSPLPGAPSRDTLTAYTRENAEGLVLGDLEWDHFADIEVEDCKVGIHTVRGTRVTFNGEMADVTVRRCSVGLLIDDMDQRWGMNLARAVFEDCGDSLVNNTRAMVKLTDVTFPKGEKIGGTVRRSEGDLSAFAFDYNRSHVDPCPAAFTAPLIADNSLEISAELQDALNQVGERGGGILYLPAGVYRLDRPVTVPEGVELRGSSSVATRGQTGWSKGTLISSVYGMGQPDTDQALVTLSSRAGVSGIRFVYRENGPAEAKTTPFVIRGGGEDVYCVNTAIAAAGSGVDFSGCDRHYIKKVTACCYDRCVLAGGKDGYIEGCLQNATVMMRQGLNFLKGWIPEGEVFEKLFPILRSRSVFLTLDGAEGERVLNYFAYGVMTVLEVRGSKDVLVINLGGDNIGDKAPLIRAEDSSLTVINAQRYNGILYETAGNCDFSFFNPLSIGDKREKNLIRGEEFSFVAVNEG